MLMTTVLMLWHPSQPLSFDSVSFPISLASRVLAFEVQEGKQEPDEEVSPAKEEVFGEMGVGDIAFKAFTAGLGVATLYLTATFSVNVYRGLAWHNAQSKMEKDGSESPPQ